MIKGSTYHKKNNDNDDNNDNSIWIKVYTEN